jgi:mannose-6-phosphate isomerase-like protein (cupin superfamily)
MHRILTGLTIAAALCAASAWAQQATHHHAVRAADLTWAPVPSLPPGALISVIEGPMNEAIPFTVRLKLPANYRIPPHTHPAVERVTVLSGTFHMGMGTKFDRNASHPVGPGDMMIMAAGTQHFGWTEGEVLLQLHGTGPWGVTYIDPADDPRKKAP